MAEELTPKPDAPDAAGKAAAVKPKKEAPPPDPLTVQSLSRPIAFATLLLLLSMGWALYDEFIGRRPWKVYQHDFYDLYKERLQAMRGEQEELQAELAAREDYQRVSAEIDSLRAAIAPQIAELDKRLGALRPKITAINAAIKPVKSEVTALTYQYEVTHEPGEKSRIKERIDALSNARYEVALGDEGVKQLDYHEMLAAFARLKAEKDGVMQQKARLEGPLGEKEAQRKEIVKRYMKGPTVEQIDGMLNNLDQLFKSRLLGLIEVPWARIRQIHVKEVDLVDRCQSCHLGMGFGEEGAQPFALTAEDMGGRAEFASHPHPELLKIHDPERFGCSTCHNGNGIAISSVKQAHGRYHHWLWPMYEKENTEAGCLQCHERSRYVEHAGTLNKGIDLFERLGCWGCHPREGFDTDRADIQSLTLGLLALNDRETDYEKQREHAREITRSRDASGEEREQARKAIDEVTLRLAALETERMELLRRRGELEKQRKDVGPNLKDIRAKLVRDWVPVWIGDPKAFRPTTRMPHFRLNPDEIEAVSAFLWQSAMEPNYPKQQSGDAAKGKDLFEKRGCMGCHSLTADGARVGGTFASELTRVGEKINYDYIVKWILDPESMNTKNRGIMPNLRLTEQEARDIAGYLMTLKTDAQYPPAEFMNNPALFEKGKTLVAHYGCFGCHEIAGLETYTLAGSTKTPSGGAPMGKIGTELTKEGSKPLERLDFGLLTHEFMKEHTYDHKHFFENKLRQPEVFDYGKEREHLERLKMPNFGLTKDEIDSLTTFLLGSVDSNLPKQFYHNPQGMQKDIQDGWWVVKKYNCMGCHQILPDVKPDIQLLPQFQGDNAKLAPPSLVGQGFRTDPDWLAAFLRNPALSETDAHRNGVRSYLDVRMPTFAFSDEEITRLVRFFNALSKQPTPFIPQKLERLSGDELEVARAAFTKSDCLLCHAYGTPDDATRTGIVGPRLTIVAERLRPEWTARWLRDPATLMPGTQMPSGLFTWDGSRWVVSGMDVFPDNVKNYKGDHLDLFVRYLSQFDEAEGAEMVKRRGQ